MIIKQLRLKYFFYNIFFRKKHKTHFFCMYNSQLNNNNFFLIILSQFMFETQNLRHIQMFICVYFIFGIKKNKIFYLENIVIHININKTITTNKNNN